MIYNTRFIVYFACPATPGIRIYLEPADIGIRGM
jgi:hypothetical protein